MATKMKMYMAIGLDKEQLEMAGHPEDSPYMQTAQLIFARSVREARGKAKKGLDGNYPNIIQQIGILKANFEGQEFNPDSENRPQKLYVVDYNDTGEGIRAGIKQQSAKAAKAGKGN